MLLLLPAFLLLLLLRQLARYLLCHPLAAPTACASCFANPLAALA
jgi:hypothetical protein